MADIIDEAQAVIESLLETEIAQRRLPIDGMSRQFCAACGERIPEARRRVVVGVRFCVECQNVQEFNLRIGKRKREDWA